MNNITVRKATDRDIESIFMLQIRVFEGEQGIPGEEVPIPFEAFPQFWCAEDGHRIIGGITAWMEDYHVHMGRFVIDPDYRGKGIGTDLLNLAFETLFSQGANVVNTEARDEVVKMLKAMGGEITGEPTMFYDSPVTPLIVKKENFRPLKG